MLTRRRCTMIAVAVLLGLVGLTAFLHTATAGKTPPPNFGGSICYSYAGQIWAMNGDGSGKHPVTPPSSWGIPSAIDHFGDDGYTHTWWLCSQVVPGGGTYPDGRAQRELYVFRTHYVNGVWQIQWVQLTDLLNAGIAPRDSVSWSNDGLDTFVSFAGHDFNQGRSFVYRAAISFSAGAMPRLAESPWPLVEVSPWVMGVPFHWSPDALSLVYGGQFGLSLYDLEGTPTWIHSGGDNGVQWSPPTVPAEQERIVFTDGLYDIRTTDPDGNDDTLLYTYTRGQSQASVDQVRSPFWSPGGNYVVFANLIPKVKGLHLTYVAKVAVVPSQGGAKTTLTDGSPVGWRASTPVP